MKVEIRSDCVVLDGYVNAVARDSRVMLDEQGEKFVEQITPRYFYEGFANGKKCGLSIKS